MRLVDFIRANRALIIAEWEAFARSLLPAGRHLSGATLRDHAAELVNALVVDMRSSHGAEVQADTGEGRSQDRRVGGAGRLHAALRIEAGFRFDQIIAEYRALRASVLRLWKGSSDARGDIEGVTRFNEAVDEALAQSTTRYLEMMERRRDRFLGMLGHDLRNPLGAITTGAQLLAASDKLEDASARIAARILSSGRRMDRMVGDLLDLARTCLGAGIPIVRAPMDLAPLCRQVIAELDVGHAELLVRFTSRGDLRGAWDADRLAQLVSNLVGNALQHGRKDAAVKVDARAEGDEVVLEVHNEGAPIAPSARTTIFEPMVRHDGADRTPGSLGLGLFIVEQVVKAHGGRIRVTSTKAGGTTFVVRLPRGVRPSEREAGHASGVSRERRGAPASRRVMVRRPRPTAPAHGVPRAASPRASRRRRTRTRTLASLARRPRG